MKQWTCIQAQSHQFVGSTIEAMERDGWTLHTYNAAHAKVALGGVAFINHYLLFNRDSNQKTISEEDKSTAAAKVQTNQLRKLKELLDTGAITDEEYEKGRKRLLGMAEHSGKTGTSEKA